MQPNYTQGTDPLSSAPKNQPLGSDNADTAPATVERYASVDEMRAEFGSYRVNAAVENLCDSSKDYPVVDPVPFPPLKNQSPFNEQSETPEGY